MKKPSIFSFFKKKEQSKTVEREARELLRENLKLVPIDIYYLDDPLLDVPPDKREAYLKKFYDICKDEDIMKRFTYLINKQVRLTMQTSMDSDGDKAGAFTINGISAIRDVFEKLAVTYAKENGKPEEDFNRFKIL